MKQSQRVVQGIKKMMPVSPGKVDGQCIYLRLLGYQEIQPQQIFHILPGSIGFFTRQHRGHFRIKVRRLNGLRTPDSVCFNKAMA